MSKSLEKEFLSFCEIQKVRILFLETFEATDATNDESRPPDKKTPTGTSAINCCSITSSKILLSEIMLF